MIGMEGKTLHSERLTYRLLEERDKVALADLLRDETVTGPAGFRPAQTPEEFDRFFRELTQNRTAVALLLGQTLLGYFHVNPCRLGDPKYQDQPCVSVGYVVGKAYQNRGYGTEALKFLTAYLKGRFAYCFADCFEGNLPSQRVILRCGYRYYERYTLYFSALGEERTCESYVY